MVSIVRKCSNWYPYIFHVYITVLVSQSYSEMKKDSFHLALGQGGTSVSQLSLKQRNEQTKPTGIQVPLDSKAFTAVGESAAQWSQAHIPACPC